MTSPRQVDANQRNSKLSTGPRSESGRATSRHNSTTHGLLAREALLPGEDGSALVALRSELYELFMPEDALQAVHVEMMTTALWRLRRLLRVEAGFFSARLDAELESKSVKAMLRLYKRMLSDEATIADGAPQSPPQGNEPVLRPEALAYAFFAGIERGDAFSKLSRYEAAIERSFYRALRELERLQAGRVPPAAPSAVALAGTPRDAVLIDEEEAIGGTG